MITAVDTNVLIDVFRGDEKFAANSVRFLRKALQEGALHACPIVWAETATFFTNQEHFLHAMYTLEIEFAAFSQESSLLAAKIWRNYRDQGGQKTRILGDFFIAAHAILHCDCLLTRDRGFYKKYFPNLKISDPTN